MTLMRARAAQIRINLRTISASVSGGLFRSSRSFIFLWFGRWGRGCRSLSRWRGRRIRARAGARSRSGWRSLRGFSRIGRDGSRLFSSGVHYEGGSVACAVAALLDGWVHVVAKAEEAPVPVASCVEPEVGVAGWGYAVVGDVGPGPVAA